MELRAAQKEWKWKDDAKKAYETIEKDTPNIEKYTKKCKKTNKNI